ncbi:acyl-CoA dehydrogenase family protein [Bradyrhizobium sp. LHD-71]|uniref:acyl-CoA dehydrogenase family protein n=1 Tax=Bradyrhizobium sp. LHD-71 TaxID=3072141 RepID=UPI0028105E9F|nr:acyl-CoA dehydrogenase family protein [Bradyrhizobium sp. LHD-71]MDQ8731014.1 acyl-CoA dehydrogenase family protein [Bradyrhizobium sp. LHD-71]
MSEPTEADVRAEVSAWLKANFNPDYGLVEWRLKLVESGWGAPHYPKEWYGRGLPVKFNAVVDEEFAKIGAVTVCRAGIRTLAAATIIDHGTDLHKEKFLRRILTGEDTWCQLFSEPGSGSDMAAATTRAELKGNKWIVNGQKVWTTSAHKADWALLLARTDWDQPKHKGLSYFLLNMRQPGVNAQPLKQMNGHASFNQVFITDAEIEPELQMGKNGEGWKIATTTLMHERRGAGALRTWAMPSTRTGRIYREENAEIATTMEPYKWYPQRAGRVDLLLDRAKATGKINDPVVRQELAKVLVLSKSAEWTAMRARAAQALGRPQGPEGSLGKLLGSHVARAAARVHTMIDGANAMLTGSDGTLDGVIAEVLVSVPATSIAGGTDEIQRNIIAERILQMPKEADPFANKPFRDVPRNTVSKVG